MFLDFFKLSKLKKSASLSTIIPQGQQICYSQIKPAVDALRSILPQLHTVIKAGRVVVPLNANTEFLFIMHAAGVFHFYNTNSGQYLIGKSQLVAYCYCGGWQAYCNGYTAPKHSIEVHHKNGHTLDNRPCNLVYLSRQDHLIVSQMSFTPFYGKNKDYHPTPFNRRGKPIKDNVHYLANIIRTTLACVSLYRSGKRLDLQLSQILASLPRKLWQHTIHWLNSPSWMNSFSIQLLNPLSIPYSGL